jgi:hypothetical protein
VTKRYLGYALAVIFIANFFSYLDRQIVSALKHELQAIYHLDNKGFGLLWTMFTSGTWCSLPSSDSSRPVPAEPHLRRVRLPLVARDDRLGLRSQQALFVRHAVLHRHRRSGLPRHRPDAPE